MNLFYRGLIALASIGIIIVDVYGIWYAFDHLVHAGSNIGGIIGYGILLIVLLITAFAVFFAGIFGVIVAAIAD